MREKGVPDPLHGGLQQAVLNGLEVIRRLEPVGLEVLHECGSHLLPPSYKVHQIPAVFQEKILCLLLVVFHLQQLQLLLEHRLEPRPLGLNGWGGSCSRNPLLQFDPLGLGAAPWNVAAFATAAVAGHQTEQESIYSGQVGQEVNGVSAQGGGSGDHLSLDPDPRHHFLRGRLAEGGFLGHRLQGGQLLHRGGSQAVGVDLEVG